MERITAALVAVLLASTAFAACGGGAQVAACDPVMIPGSCPKSARQQICDYAMPAGTFDGSLVERAGKVVTFRVESVAGRPSPSDHPPVRDRLIAVHYDNGDERRLHAGDRYRVLVWWLRRPAPAHYFSSVYTPKRDCSGGTIHADGTPIS